MLIVEAVMQDIMHKCKKKHEKQTSHLFIDIKGILQLRITHITLSIFVACYE